MRTTAVAAAALGAAALVSEMVLGVGCATAARGSAPAPETTHLSPPPAPAVAQAPRAPAPAAAAVPGAAPVYFSLDSSDFGDDEATRERLSALAAYLLATPQARLVVEGHTDERGTSEYNLALGDRRARAVATYLRHLGVPETQVALVTYGKEHPAAAGHDEDAWQRNRRDELKLSPPSS